MPAYRSPAEGEIREAVVVRLREARPAARILHEVNCGSFGPNRIDLIAVSPEEIIAVEIKSERDKLERLPAQIASMRGVAHIVVAAIHERFMLEEETNRWAAHSEREGVFYRRSPPPECAPADETWVYPQRSRVMDEARIGFDWDARWHLRAQRHAVALPENALGMLWADELGALCAELRVPVGRRATRTSCITALRWLASGKEITAGVCAALRRRDCAEADPPCPEAHADA